MSNDLQQRIRNLRTIEQKMVPDAAWVRATRKTLLMQAHNTLPQKSVMPHVFVSEAVRHLFAGRVGVFIRRPIMAVLSLIVVATGGSMMSVSAAERSLPGDFLYGLKLATEQARLALTSTKEEKLKLKTEFTERRVKELKVVAKDQKNPERTRQVAEILKSDLNTLKEQLSEVRADSSPQTAAAAAKLVDQKTTEAISTLQDTKTDLSPETKQKVTEAQTIAAETSVKAIEVLVEKNQESKEVVPVADVAEAIQNHANAMTSLSDDVPLEMGGTSSTTTTLNELVQSVASSTGSLTTSTTALPRLMDQVKDITAQTLAVQRDKEKKESSASTTGAVPPSTSDTTTTKQAPSIPIPSLTTKDPSAP